MPKVEDAAYEVETDCANLNPVEIARVIGTFADDPPDTPFQHAYLHALWKFFLHRMPPRMLVDAFYNQTGARVSDPRSVVKATLSLEKPSK